MNCHLEAESVCSRDCMCCTLFAVKKNFTKMSVCAYSDGLASLKHSEAFALSGWRCHGAIGEWTWEESLANSERTKLCFVSTKPAYFCAHMTHFFPFQTVPRVLSPAVRSKGQATSFSGRGPALSILPTWRGSSSWILWATSQGTRPFGESAGWFCRMHKLY